VLAGQQSAAEGVVDDVEQPGVRAELGVLLLHAAGQQVVERLGEHRGGAAGLGGHAAQLGDLPGGEVGDAQRADGPVRHELADRGEGLGEGDRAVGLVQVVDVEPVDAEPGEAALDARVDRLARQRRRPVGVGMRHAHLARDGEPAAPAGEQLAEDLLAARARVAVGRVDHGDARLCGGVEHAGRGGGVDRVTDVHGAQHEPGDREPGAGNSGALHG
jgi:hypothetical protein